MEVFKVSLSDSCTSLKAASMPPQESHVCASVGGLCLPGLVGGVLASVQRISLAWDSHCHHSVLLGFIFSFSFFFLFTFALAANSLTTVFPLLCNRVWN